MRPSPDAFGDQRLRIVGVAQQHEHADEVRAALRRRARRCKRAQQLVDVGRGVAVLAGVARRVQAGRAVERIDAQAGIVGQRGQAGGARRRGAP